MRTFRMCIGLCMLGFMVSMAQAGTYVFDSSVTNWYANGLTVAQNGTTVETKMSIGDNDYQNQIFCAAVGTEFFGLMQGVWAGAEWIVPEGEIVTSVTISGYFRSDGRNVGVGVFGGDTTADETEYYSCTNLDDFALNYADVAIPISVTDGVTKLQFRALWAILGSGTYAGYPYSEGEGGYRGDITAITITTVPEPVSITMLAVGLLGLLRRYV